MILYSPQVFEGVVYEIGRWQRLDNYFSDNNLLCQLFGEGRSCHEEGEENLPFLGVQVVTHGDFCGDYDD